MAKTVTKRDGHTVTYDVRKIYKAVEGANNDIGAPLTRDKLNQVVLAIAVKLKNKDNVSVEEIQDTVEDTLMSSGYPKLAKTYILYRQKHAERRKAVQDLMESYNDLLFADSKDMDLKRDNANINTDAPMGIMLKLGAEGAKTFAKNYALPEEFVKPHVENYYHIHDMDFSFITLNCLQQDLGKTLKGGFNTGHGFLREPNSIRAAASLACISVQSSQNDCFGGQSISALDFCLAPYVDRSFRKAFRTNLSKITQTLNGFNALDTIKEIPDEEIPNYKGSFDFRDFNDLGEHIKVFLDTYFPFNEDPMMSLRPNGCAALKEALKFSEADVEEETKQAMEAMVHNFNSLHSRAGGQVPFSSINYGMDTSPEGRLVTKWTLEAIWNGLGNGETPIFPISVFLLKKGVNYDPGDPNYDLFVRACEVSAKRLFPNFVSVDAPYNLKYYVPGDYRTFPTTMGCRTKVLSNVNGPNQSSSRGNFAHNTINLPMLALDAKAKYPDDEEKRIKYFYELFDKYIDLSKRYLEYRYNIIAHKKVKNFPFLMGQHLWMGSEELKEDDEIGSVLKHASISIGFCGLAECLVALVGHHHGESDSAQALGLEIVRHLRHKTDEFTQATHMNWSCFSSPAESTAGDFMRACQKKYGKILGITDHEYETNSFHVPVYYHTTAQHKIDIEAPYHAECNAGCISYIEMDGDPTKNVKAFMKVVRAMHDANMNYFSINHPVDRDPVCGYTGIIENECPHCHRKENETGHMRVERAKK